MSSSQDDRAREALQAFDARPDYFTAQRLMEEVAERGAAAERRGDFLSVAVSDEWARLAALRAATTTTGRKRRRSHGGAPKRLERSVKALLRAGDDGQ